MDTSKLSQAEKTQLTNIEKQSGKSMSEWILIVQDSGIKKHGELVTLLKEKFGFTHGNANMVVHWANQSFAGVSDGDELVESQYKGKDSLRPFFDQIMKSVRAFGPDIESVPKKGYVSLRRKKQFAILQPSTKSRLDIGLNIKGVNPEGILEAGGSWNAMCTHRIKIEVPEQITSEVMTWIKVAYDQAG